MKTYRERIEKLEAKVRTLELAQPPIRPLTADEEGRFANPRTGIRPMHRFPPARGNLPAPAVPPAAVVKEPVPFGDLATRLAEHLCEYSDLRRGELGQGDFRFVVERVIRSFLAMNEGTEVCVGPTVSGRVHVSIPDGNTVRLSGTEAAKMSESLFTAISTIKNETSAPKA